MHLHNKPAFTVIFCLLFCILVAGSAFARPQASQGQQNQNVQPTPLPSDVDPADPALPVWMRPANPTPPATSPSTTSKNAGTAAPNDTDIVPSSKAPTFFFFKQKTAYEMIKRVQNIMLP